MRFNIDELPKDTRKLYRHVADTNTHEIVLTFLCKIAKTDNHLIVVNEAKQITSITKDNLLALADELRALQQKYRHFGCVGYKLLKKEVEI